MKQIVIYDVVCSACVQNVRTNISGPLTLHHRQILFLNDQILVSDRQTDGRTDGRTDGQTQ